MAGRPAFSNGRKWYTPRTVDIDFSFKVPATPATTAPTVFRDGQGSQVSSITIASGVYTVTLKALPSLPQQITTFRVDVAPAVTGTNKAQVQYVAESWDPSARTFTLVVRDSSDGTVGAGSLLTAADWVSVRLSGPDVISAKDAA